MVDRGHDVLWAVPPDGVDHVQRTGIRAAATGTAGLTHPAEVRRRYPELDSLPPDEAPATSCRLAPGVLIPPHTHRLEDEITYVVVGEVTAEIGGETIVAPAGSYLLKPRGVSHAFWNSGEGEAKVMEIHAPGGFEQFYDDMEVVAASPMSKDERLTAFRATAAEYGVEHHLDQIDAVRARHNLS